MEKKEQLLKAGKVIFSEKGFKDSNVAELARAAGMATGTFYLYFPSKEALFMDLFFKENEVLKKSLMASFNPEAEPLEAIQALMQQNLQGMAANPILKEWFNRDIFQKIEEKYREENGLERLDFLYDSFLGIVENWQAEGKLRADIPSDMIMALFAAIIVIDAHKAEIGYQYFPKIQDYLTAFVMKGLTDVSS